MGWGPKGGIPHLDYMKDRLGIGPFWKCAGGE